MKTVKEYLAEANKMVPKLSVGEAIAWHETGKGIFIDILDGLTIKTPEPSQVHCISRTDSLSLLQTIQLICITAH